MPRRLPALAIPPLARHCVGRRDGDGGVARIGHGPAVPERDETAAGFVPAAMPPSTAMTAPVTKLLAGEHSHSTASAISAGEPMRRIGVA
jgi:hypothetical protein